MNQELLALAKAIDDNEDAIADALEAEDLEQAELLTQEKVTLFKKLYELSLTIDDRSVLDEYLNSLYDVTSEQRDLLVAEHERVRKELGSFKKGSRGNKTYQQVKQY